MGGPDNIDRSSIISNGGMSNHDMPLPSSGPNCDIHKRVTRASAASAAAGSHASNGSSSATGKAPSSSAYSAADTNGNSCSQDSSRRQKPPTLSASTSSASSSSSSLPKPAPHHHPNSKWTWAGYLLLLAVTKYTLPDELHTSAPTLKHVWFYGWVTALSTGVGAAPLILTHDLGKAMLAYGNAIAAGMMLSASFSLVSEGATVVEPNGSTAEWSAVFAAFLGAPWARVVLGVVAGLVFILSTKKVLDNYEDIKLGELHGMDAKKVLLIVFVMTLHSFSEGVGIGVSFGGDGGARLGFLISATLAVHNVPEGLAVALVLHPRGVSKLNTGLWCVFTSLPQPLMAVPAFLFVGQFMPFLPIGLGFAAGAMFWVACFELFSEAIEDSSIIKASVTTGLSFAVMLYAHSYFEHEA
ncbi:unnamed protein product [Ectocarpus sp. CCAP 1310/34]|nr:unnamed protein product [Ectocarpus sp. CCAP 1310/34]